MTTNIEVGTYTPGSGMIYIETDSRDTWGYQTRCKHILDIEDAETIIDELYRAVQEAERMCERK